MIDGMIDSHSIRSRSSPSVIAHNPVRLEVSGGEIWRPAKQRRCTITIQHTKLPAYHSERNRNRNVASSKSRKTQKMWITNNDTSVLYLPLRGLTVNPGDSSTNFLQKPLSEHGDFSGCSRLGQQDSDKGDLEKMDRSGNGPCAAGDLRNNDHSSRKRMRYDSSICERLLNEGNNNSLVSLADNLPESQTNATTTSSDLQVPRIRKSERCTYNPNSTTDSTANAVTVQQRFCGKSGCTNSECRTYCNCTSHFRKSSRFLMHFRKVQQVQSSLKGQKPTSEKTVCAQQFRSVYVEHYVNELSNPCTHRSKQNNGYHHDHVKNCEAFDHVKTSRSRKHSESEFSLFSLFSWITFHLIRLLGFETSSRRKHSQYKGSRLLSTLAIFVFWALIAIPGHSKRVLGSSLLFNPDDFCGRGRLLSRTQQEICRNYSDLVKYVEEGVRLGSKRCQNEFQYNRWNCSHTPKPYYGRLLTQDTRETSYLSAVTSAAVTYTITYACSTGAIEECGCGDERVGSYHLLKQEAIKRNMKVNESDLLRAASTFKWGGCSDNIDYGYRMSRLFLDNFGRQKQSERGELKNLVEKHNYEAGRLVIKNHMIRQCRCHGISASCALETCWNKMQKWQNIGNIMRKRYDGAIRVHLGNDGRSLLPSRRQRKHFKQYWFNRKAHATDVTLNRRYKRAAPMRPGIYPPDMGTASLKVVKDRADSGRDTLQTRGPVLRLLRSRRRHRRGGADRKLVITGEHLIYSQESSNFCKRSRRQGSLGTRGRRCIPHVSGPGNCDYLCCGRSYTQHQIRVTKSCNCRLKTDYCCELICDDCSVLETVYTCN